MRTMLRWAAMCVLGLTGVLGAVAQEPVGGGVEGEATLPVARPGVPPSPALGGASVLRLIRFNGAVRDALGRPRTGVSGISFAFYAEQEGGAPLWVETQNVTLDEQGRYTALLGITSNEGLPLELFSTEEARWLAIRVQGEREQPRVLLVSVPYALKAADAERLGGRPASAFVLAEPAEGLGTEAGEAPVEDPKAQVGGTGTTNMVAKFTATDTIGDSQIFDNGTNVGIGTTSPTNKLQVNGNIRLIGQTTHQVQVTGSASSGRLGQDVNGFFFASDTAGKQLNFFTNAGAGIQRRITITGDGNVGIGLSAPTSKLEVAGNSVSPALKGVQSSASGAAVEGVASGTDPGANAGRFLKLSSGIVFSHAALHVAHGGSLGEAAWFGLGNAANPTPVLKLVLPAGSSGTFFQCQRPDGTNRCQIDANGNIVAGGSVTATQFIGDGSLLTNLPGSGNADTLDGLDSTQFARVDMGNSFLGNQSINGNVVVSGNTANEIVHATQQKAGVPPNVGEVPPAAIVGETTSLSQETAGVVGLVAGEEAIGVLGAAPGGGTGVVGFSTDGMGVLGQVTGGGEAVRGSADESGVALSGTGGTAVLGITSDFGSPAARFGNSSASGPGGVDVIVGQAGAALVNVFRLDGNGNVVASGDFQSSTPGNGLILKSPNGSVCRRLSIDNSGNLASASVACPADP